MILAFFVKAFTNCTDLDEKYKLLEILEKMLTAFDEKALKIDFLNIFWKSSCQK